MSNLDFIRGGGPALTRVMTKEEVMARLLARGAPANAKSGNTPRDPGPAAPASRRPVAANDPAPLARAVARAAARPVLARQGQAGGQVGRETARPHVQSVNRLKSAALRAADLAIKRWNVDLARETRRIRQIKLRAETILRRAQIRAEAAQDRLKARTADREAVEAARAARKAVAKVERETRLARKAEERLQSRPMRVRIRPVTGRVNMDGLNGRARVLAQTTPKGSVIVSLAVAPDVFGSGLKVRDRVRLTLTPDVVTVVRCDPTATPTRPGRLSSDMWVNAYKANLRLTLGVASKLGLPPLRLAQSAAVTIRPVEGGFAFDRAELAAAFNQMPVPVDLRLEGTTLLASRPVAVSHVAIAPDGALSLDGIKVMEVQDKRPGVGAHFARKHDLSIWLDRQAEPNDAGRVRLIGVVDQNLDQQVLLKAA